MLDLRFRPLSKWPGERTAMFQRPPRGPFQAGYPDTLNKLEKELIELKAKDVVIEAGFKLADLRNDGWPKNGIAPSDPGVIIAFHSKHGPLKLHCDYFRRYEDNIRAIAMHLERLRLASLYGVGTRGEQYKGYAQLEAPAAPITMSVDEAAALLGSYISLSASELLSNGGQDLADAYKIAARRTHPDRGGDINEFRRVNEAKKIIDGKAGA
jgi:hypothetical protein